MTVRDLENPGMIALRGDHGTIAGICRDVTGAAFPAMGRIERSAQQADDHALRRNREPRTHPPAPFAAGLAPPQGTTGRQLCRAGPRL